jgi:hypothetical protein
VARFNKPVYIAKTKYVDWSDAPGIDNVLVACSRKDLSYRHECEVRVLIPEYSTGCESKRPPGIRLSVDIDQLITEVMVGPREQNWVPRLVEKVLARYGLPQPVIASDRLTPRR